LPDVGCRKSEVGGQRADVRGPLHFIVHFLATLTRLPLTDSLSTNDEAIAEQARRFRSHGVTVDFKQRMESNFWFYEMVDLGWNYRITDIQCALGQSQLKKLPAWIARRNEIAGIYDTAFSRLAPSIRLLASDFRPPSSVHGRHLYVIRVPAMRRAEIFASLRKQGIGVNVHYIPIHMHPFYRERFGTGPGLCPVAEHAYEELISLPLYPGMTDDDVETVVSAVRAVV